MKRLIKSSTIAWCLLPLSLLIAGGCGGKEREDKAGKSHWQPITEKIDRLSLSLDSMMIVRAPTGEVKAVLEKLREAVDDVKKKGGKGDVASAERIKKGEERLKFFDISYQYYAGEYDKFMEGFEELIQNTDSVKNPYLYNRLLYIAPDSPNRDLEVYEDLNKQVTYFREAGDEVMTARALIEIGNLMKGVRDPQAAEGFYNQADSLFLKNGYDITVTFNKLNHASDAFLLRDTVTGVRILHEMLEIPAVKEDTLMLSRVLHNLFIEGEEQEAILPLYALYGEESDPLVETFMSNYLLNSDSIPGAVYHARRAVEKARVAENYNDLGIALYAYSDALSAHKDTVEAYKALLEAVEITDEIATTNEPDAIKERETDRMLSVRRLEAELKSSKLEVRILWIFIAFLIVGGAVGWWIYRRVERLKERQRRAAAEKAEAERRLLATQIAMDETNQVLSDVERAVEDMKRDKEGVKSGNRSKEIASAIHTHKVKSGERESFIESFSQVNPDFARRLKEINSAFTEPDIRLASYIVTGMDNKKTAVTMGILPESVKQARWRLRSKLKLEKGASLEEALRDINKGR